MAFRRIAVIGCGAAAWKHAEEWRHDPSLVLAAAADSSLGALMKFGSRFDLPQRVCYTDVEAMLRAERPSLVAVCTWPNSHPALVARCAALGVRGVLCESPLATSAADASTVLRLARQSGMVVAEGHAWRHHPRFARLLEVVLSGTLGRVRSVRVAVREPVRNRKSWRLRASLGGGVVLDAGPVAIQAAVALAGRRVERVSCLTEGLTNAYGILRFTNGVHAQFELSFEGNRMNEIVVIGTSGRATLSPFVDRGEEPAAIDIDRRPDVVGAGDVEPGAVHAGASSETAFTPGALQYLTEMRNLRDAVEERGSLLTGSAESRASARVLDACVRSAREGRVVSV